jgi:hypothetical protein
LVIRSSVSAPNRPLLSIFFALVLRCWLFAAGSLFLLRGGRLWEAQGASDNNVAIRWVAAGGHGFFAPRQPGHVPAVMVGHRFLLTFVQELEVHPATLPIVLLVPPAADSERRPGGGRDCRWSRAGMGRRCRSLTE